MESMAVAPPTMALGSISTLCDKGRWSASVFAFVFSIFSLFSLVRDLSSDWAIRLTRARCPDVDLAECKLEAAHKELRMCRKKFLYSKSALFDAEERPALVQNCLHSP